VSSTTCTDGVAAVERFPATLRLGFVAGDDFSCRLTINRNLTGYTLTAVALNADTGGTVATFGTSIQTVTIAGQTATRVTITLTKTQTAAMAAVARLRWSFRWAAADTTTRTILIGRVRPISR
jgi:hypothetical protein